MVTAQVFLVIFVKAVRQASAPPPLFFAARVRRRLRVPPKRGGQSADRRWVRNAAPFGPPRGRADPWIARDYRPMTLAGAPLGAPPRHFWRSSHFAAAPGRASGPGMA